MKIHSLDGSDVNRLREELKGRLLKLSNALKHWQVWEAEYEGFKEELEARESESSAEEIVCILLAKAKSQI
jgi:unconventional prefoldin RPB5 interactor 1